MKIIFYRNFLWFSVISMHKIGDKIIFFYRIGRQNFTSQLFTLGWIIWRKWRTLKRSHSVGMLNCSGQKREFNGQSMRLLLSTDNNFCHANMCVQNPQLCMKSLYWHHWNNMSLQGQNVIKKWNISMAEFKHIIKLNLALNGRLIMWQFREIYL